MSNVRNAKIVWFDIVMAFMFIILCFLTIYPFIYALSYSVSDGFLVAQKSIVFLPRGFTLQSYHIMFSDNRVLNAAFISVSKTVLGTFLFLAVTGMCAYSMSKKCLKGKKIIFIFFVIPMYIGGGLIPFYMLIHDLGLMNNFLVYILPACYGTFFMFLIKVYLETIPESLEESAKLDGALDLDIALKIYLPLSKPIIATVALFAGVGQWNSWFDAMLFVSNSDLHPLQMMLQTLLRETQIDNMLDVYKMRMNSNKKIIISPETYKMAVLIITTLPIVFIYPFAQKYFVKGMTIGAVKL